jgi:hypothetical protein
MKKLLPLLFVLLCSPLPLRAEVQSLIIHERKDFAGGHSFGEVGPYEIIRGVAKFAIDPKHERNKLIVDLDKAPRNSEGKVEFESDVYILAPKNPAKGMEQFSTMSTIAAENWPCASSMIPRDRICRKTSRTPVMAIYSAAAIPSSGAVGSAN